MQTPRATPLLLPLAAALLAGSLLPLAGGCSRSGGSSTRRASGVRLNEIMAANSRRNGIAVEDESDQPVYADWVELYNPGTAAVSLAGYTLSDRRDNPDKYELPPGTVIAAGGYLIVFFYSQESCENNAQEDANECNAECDQDQDVADDRRECEMACVGLPDEVACKGRCKTDADTATTLCRAECTAELTADEAACVAPQGYVADFNLSGTGETLFLFADGGRFLVDQVGVKSQGAALSNGVDPVTGDYGIIYEPTPRAKNPPVNVKPQAVSVPSFPATCEAETEVRMAVDRDVAAPGGMVVTLAYADVDDPGQAGGADFQAVDVVPYTPSGEDPIMYEDRLGVDGTLIEDVPRERHSYMAFVPASAGACGKTRVYRVTAVDAVATVRYTNTLVCCQERLPVIVNEYQPRNSRNGFVFEYVSETGETRNVDPDWIEVHNFGAATVDISRLGLITGNDYQRYLATDPAEQPVERASWWRFGTQSGAELPVTLPAGAYLWILADSDRGERRREYTFFSGDAEVEPDRRFYSTNFGLDPSPDAPGQYDSFVLVDTTTGTALDLVVLNFSTNGNDLEQDKSVGRFPETEGTEPNALRPGTPTDCPTFEAPNVLECDVPPAFLRELAIADAAGKPFPDRCPPAGVPVTVRTKVNVDSDVSIDSIEASLDFWVEGGATPTTVIAEVEPSEGEAAPASKLYEVSAVIPAQTAGALVEFSLAVKATDPANPTQPGTAVLKQEGEDDPLSFRYVQGFVALEPSPVLNEVLPGNTRLPVHPVFGDPPTDTPDFAEIHNPSAEPLNLAGYFLTTTKSAMEAIAQPRLFRFPDEGSIVEPNGFLVVYFGPPPADQEAPADYIQVSQFNLDDCSETLHLISPDDARKGGNFRLDSLSWNLQHGEEITDCTLDTAVGPLCETCAGDRCLVELEAPSPRAANATTATLSPELYDANHFVFTPLPASIPVPPDQNVDLETVLFLDKRWHDVFSGRWRDAIVKAAYLVEGAPQTEYVFAGSRDTMSDYRGCDEEVIPGCTAPDGYVAVLFVKSSIAPPFAPVVRYRLQITDACGNTFTAPEATFGTTAGEHPAVVINEINRSSPVPGAPAARSWIELFNTTNAAVDLSGVFLSNDPGNPRRASLPAGTMIPAGGILLVLTDGSPLPPYTHAPLAWATLSPTSLSYTGRLFLSDSPERGTCLLDAIDYDFSGVGVGEGDSLGRDPDGAAGGLTKLPEPSPGARNSPALTFLRGDATEDLKLNVSDMIRILAVLFSGDPRRPACLDAMDADDNGVANLADPVYIGNFVFQKGQAIPPPFPAPGLDPTPDGVPECSR